MKSSSILNRLVKINNRNYIIIDDIEEKQDKYLLLFDIEEEKNVVAKRERNTTNLDILDKNKETEELLNLLKKDVLRKMNEFIEANSDKK